MAVTQLNTRYIRCSAAADAITKDLVINFIRWVGATSADTLVLSDSNAIVIAESAANSNDFVDIIPINDVIPGLTVTTMGSGTLIIYLQ